jgi:hypothetical protein
MKCVVDPDQDLSGSKKKFPDPYLEIQDPSPKLYVNINKIIKKI